MATPIPTPNLMRKIVVLQSSGYESIVIYDVLLCSGKNTPFLKSLNKFGFLTLNNCADLSFNTFSTLKINKNVCLVYVVLKIAPIIEMYWFTMVDSM